MSGVGLVLTLLLAATLAEAYLSSSNYVLAFPHHVTAVVYISSIQSTSIRLVDYYKDPPYAEKFDTSWIIDKVYFVEHLKRPDLPISASIHITGDSEFRVIVEFLHDSNAGDRMTALPVLSFGRKYVVCYEKKRSYLMIVTNSPEANVELALTNLVGSNANNIIHHTISRYQSFFYGDQNCDQSSTDTVTKSVTITSTETIGVIVAYCGFSVKNKGMWSVEMPYPTESFGKKFINIARAGTDPITYLGEQDFIRIVCLEDGTTVSVTTLENSLVADITLHNAGDLRDIPCHAEAFHQLKATKPISCTFHHVISGVNYVSSLTLMVPVELFFHYYYWSSSLEGYSSQVLHENTTTDVMKVLCVVRQNQLSRLVMDGRRVETPTSSPTIAPPGHQWQVHAFQLQQPATDAIHHLYTDDGTTFGLYVYHRADDRSAMYPGLFNSVNLTSTCRPTPMVPGDQVDNDCDGQVDEDSLPGQCQTTKLESLSATDDDGDGSVDEDVGCASSEDLQWAQWEEWECLGNGDKTMTRRNRNCSDPPVPWYGKPCLGTSVELSSRWCLVKGAKDCIYRNCDCSNCMKKKIKGQLFCCPYCQYGWRGPMCTEPCPNMTYGRNCEFDCAEKCQGSDCVERTTGICPPFIAVDYILLALFGYLSISITVILVYSTYFISTADTGKQETPSTSSDDTHHSSAPSKPPDISSSTEV